MDRSTDGWMSEQQLTLISIAGYKIKSLGSQGKKLFGICLAHSEGPSLNLAANDQVDFTRWFMALEAASKAEVSLPKQVVDTSKTESIPPKTESMPPKTEDLDKEKVSIGRNGWMGGWINEWMD